MNRRKLLVLLGATGLSVFGYAFGSMREKQKAKKMYSCVATPQQTEGPYFVDERLHRADIRSDPSDGSVKDGVLLALEIRVFSITANGESCEPLPGAIGDIWHCDAQGVYSDVKDRSFNTIGSKFLRGYQISDREGQVQFLTIYPGWYPGRSVHIHFKIRTRPKYGRAREFTSQLYFDDSLTDQVHAREHYSRRPPTGENKAEKGLYEVRTRNEEDSIFRKGGDQLMLELLETDQGYAASFSVGIKS